MVRLLVIIVKDDDNQRSNLINLFQDMMNMDFDLATDIFDIYEYFTSSEPILTKGSKVLT